MGRIEGKVAIITGAGNGFGRESALLFADEGASVVIADFNEEAGAKVAAEIQEKGQKALFVKVDITKPQEVEALVRRTVEAYGKLDILFNNAGYQTQCDDIAHMPVEVFDRFMEVNVRGTWLCCHYAAPYLVKTKGAIVNTASIAASLGSYGGTAYGVSKGAVISMTYSLANELGLYGVRANAISPASAMTPVILKEYGQDFIDLRKSGNPLNRLVDMKHVAYAALYLASDEAGSCTGMNLLVDCGACIRSQPFILEDYLKRNPYEV